MATDLYARMAATAVRLLASYGVAVTLPRTTGSSGPDPVTGAATAGTADNKSTVGILINYPANLIDGTRIKATDKLLVLSGSVEPVMTDTPQMNGETLGVVVSIQKKSPDNATDIVFFVQVRS